MTSVKLHFLVIIYFFNFAYFHQRKKMKDISAQEQFLAALDFLLKKEGFGSQTKLANAVGMKPNFVNNILKKRSPGPQDKKEKMANYFGMKYEEMLAFGRKLIEEENKNYGVRETPTVYYTLNNNKSSASELPIDIELLSKSIEHTFQHLDNNLGEVPIDKLSKVIALLYDNATKKKGGVKDETDKIILSLLD